MGRLVLYLFTLMILSLNTGCFLHASITNNDFADSSPSTSPTPGEPANDLEKIVDLSPNLMRENVSLLNTPVNINSKLYISPDKKIGLRFAESHGFFNDIINFELFIVYLDGTKRLDKVKFPFRITSSQNVVDLKFTADSKSIVFRSNYQNSSTIGLYKINLDGTGLACLSCPMVTGSQIANFGDYTLIGSPERVIFFANIENTSKQELFSNNLEGTALTKLNTPLTGAGMISSYNISSDGNYVVYSGNHTLASPKHIFVVATNGTGLLKLNSDGIAGNSGAFNPLFSPDNLKIAFNHDRTVIGQHELFIVDRNGNNEIQISPNIRNGSFLFTPDGSRVIFHSSHAVIGKTELYSAAADGSGTIKLNIPLSDNTDAGFVTFSPLGDKLIYTSDDTTDNQWNMYSINFDGSNRVLLHSNMVSLNFSYQSYNPQPLFLNNNTFFYLADAGHDSIYEIYKINLDGTGGQLVFAPPGGYVILSLTSLNGASFDSSKSYLAATIRKSAGYDCFKTVINLSNFSTNDIYNCNTINSDFYDSSEVLPNNTILIMTKDQMFQLSLDGSQKEELFFYSNEFSRGFKLSPDGNTLLSLGRHNNVSLGINTLESYKIDSKTSETLISDLTKYISDFFISPDSSVIHFYDTFTPSSGFFDLYKMNINGSGLLKLNGATPYRMFTYLGGFKYIPNSQRLAIYAEQGATFKKEIFGMDYDGANYVKLHPAIADDAETFHVSPLGNKILYTMEQDVNNVIEIYSSNIDGTGNVKLNAPLPTGGDVSFDQYEISPDGQKALFIGDHDINDVQELFSVNMDGTSRVKVHPSLALGQNVFDFRVASNSQKIIFLGNVDSSTENELFSANIDGSNFQKISGSIITGGEVITSGSIEVADKRIKISNNSQKAVFLAKKEDLSKSELYSVNLDGTHLTKISPAFTFPDISISKFYISDDSSKVIFQSNFDDKDKFQLYSVDIDGNNLKKLSRSFSKNDAITNFSVIDNKLVYRLVRDDKAELYKINLDGTNHVRFHSDLQPNQNVGISYIISPDKSKIIFHLNKSNYIKSNLYWAPL